MVRLGNLLRPLSHCLYFSVSSDEESGKYFAAPPGWGRAGASLMAAVFRLDYSQHFVARGFLSKALILKLNHALQAWIQAPKLPSPCARDNFGGLFPCTVKHDVI